MEPLTFFLLLFGASLGAGVLGALLGLGGGVIVVPTLTLLVGLNFHYAIGASIVAAIAVSSGAAASYVKDRITNLRMGTFLKWRRRIGAVTGAYAAGSLPGRVLSVIFGVVLIMRRGACSSISKRTSPLAWSRARCAARLRFPTPYSPSGAQGNAWTTRSTGVPEGSGRCGWPG